MPELRTLAAIEADLGKPIPARLLKTKPKGGQQLTYITWQIAVRFLDLYAPGWQYNVTPIISLDGMQVVVSANIGIPTSDYGVVWRGGTGQAGAEKGAYGAAVTRAEGQALRRAATKFKLALYLYNKDEDVAGAARTSNNKATSPDPDAGEDRAFAELAAQPAPTTGAARPFAGPAHADPRPPADVLRAGLATVQQIGAIGRLWAAKGVSLQEQAARLARYGAADVAHMTERAAADEIALCQDGNAPHAPALSVAPMPRLAVVPGSGEGLERTSNLLTEKQEKAIFGAGHGAGLSNAEIIALAQERFHHPPDQLNRAEASQLIDLLKSMPAMA